MCEFRVIKKVGGEERSIASDIVRFGIEDGRLVLYDIVGSREVLDDSVVKGLNVSRERIDIIQAPGISRLLAFIDAFSKAYASREYDERLEAAWKDVKMMWDENFIRLRDTCGNEVHSR